MLLVLCGFFSRCGGDVCTMFVIFPVILTYFLKIHVGFHILLAKFYLTFVVNVYLMQVISVTVKIRLPQNTEFTCL